MQREPGFYWVKYDHGDRGWQVADWDGHAWWVTGLHKPLFRGFDHIGDRITPPEDK